MTSFDANSFLKKIDTNDGKLALLLGGLFAVLMAFGAGSSIVGGIVRLVVYWVIASLAAYAAVRIWRIHKGDGLAMSRWPPRREFRVTHEGRAGFPVVDWCEGRLYPPRSCSLVVDGQTGVPMFTHFDSTYMDSATKRKYGMWAIIVGVVLLLVLPLLGAMDAAKHGQPPLVTFFGGFVVMSFVYGAVALAYLGYLYIRVRVMPFTGGTRFAAPWAALEAFQITDEKTYHGRIIRDKDGTEQAPNSILLALFGTSAPPIEISNWKWSQAALGELHRILTVEFIEKRQAHMEKLKAIQAAVASSARLRSSGGTSSKPGKL